MDIKSDTKSDTKLDSKHVNETTKEKQQLSSDDTSEIIVWKTGVLAFSDKTLELVRIKLVVKQDVPRQGHEACPKCLSHKEYGYSVVDKASVLLILDQHGFCHSQAMGLEDARVWTVGETICANERTEVRRVITGFQNTEFKPASYYGWPTCCVDGPSGIVVQRFQKNTGFFSHKLRSLACDMATSEWRFCKDQIELIQSHTANTWEQWRSESDSIVEVMKKITDFDPLSIRYDRNDDSKQKTSESKQLTKGHELDKEKELIVWKLGAHFPDAKSSSTDYIPVMIQLRVLPNAHRVTQYKCGHFHCNMMRKSRVSSAQVLSIVDTTGKAYTTARGYYQSFFSYTVGQDVKPDSFDANPEVCCGHGIHVHKEAVDCLVHLLIQKMQSAQKQFSIEEVGIYKQKISTCPIESFSVDT